MKEHYKYVLKQKKKFPFISIYKRKEFKCERINREVNDLYNVLPIVIIVIVLSKIIEILENKLKN